MRHDRTLRAPTPLPKVFDRSFHMQLVLNGLSVDYDCLPAFDGEGATKPNRIGVVFSGHASVVLAQGGSVYDAIVSPGALYVVGSAPPTLLRVREYSEILKIYPDMTALAASAEAEGISAFEIEPTLRRCRSPAFVTDLVFLSVAHRLRQACLGQTTLSDVEAGELVQLIAARVLRNQYGTRPRFGPTVTLNDRRLRTLADYVEAHLTKTITLDDLAGLVGISPFHFARCFRMTTGLAPHQFVAARRFDLARRHLITTGATVQQIALSVGYENLSHFRRQFVTQFGIAPGELRQAAIRQSAP